jgi:flavin-dependent dehydrogenase
VGETLSPLARRLLEHLRVWDAFLNQRHPEVYGTAAAWGSSILHENDFLFTTQGVGWHLDRAAFDALLAGEAERQGVHLLRQTRVTGAERAGESWRLKVSSGAGALTPLAPLSHLPDPLPGRGGNCNSRGVWGRPSPGMGRPKAGEEAGEGMGVRARFVVDATGSSAAWSRWRGARFVASDHLAGFARFFEERERSDPRTLVEAFADGWWYTAGLPGGLRVAACLTDSDLARRLRLREPSSWSRLLAGTERVSAALRGAEPRGPVVVRATPSRLLEPVAGEGWLAVGDAASVFDPLSSAGIVKGLRSGIFASYAIADLLTKGDGRGLQRYRRYVREEFESYSRTRAKYYAEERRWPGSEFWRRRQGAGSPSPGT